MVKLEKANGKLVLSYFPYRKSSYGLQWLKRTIEGLILNFYFGANTKIKLILKTKKLDDLTSLLIKVQDPNRAVPSFYDFKGWLNELKISFEEVNRDYNNELKLIL